MKLPKRNDLNQFVRIKNKRIENKFSEEELMTDLFHLLKTKIFENAEQIIKHNYFVLELPVEQEGFLLHNLERVNEELEGYLIVEKHGTIIMVLEVDPPTLPRD